MGGAELGGGGVEEGSSDGSSEACAAAVSSGACTAGTEELSLPLPRTLNNRIPTSTTAPDSTQVSRLLDRAVASSSSGVGSVGAGGP